MSRSVKKISRLTTYFFFLVATFVVSSVLSVFQMKRSETQSNIPPLAPTAHADVPPSGDGGGLDTECTTDASDSDSACASDAGDSSACGASAGGADAGSDGE